MSLAERWWCVDDRNGSMEWTQDPREADAAREDDYDVSGPWVLEAQQPRGAVALLEEVRSRSRRPFGGHAPYDLAVRIERFLDDGVYEPHPAAGGQ